MVALAQAFVVVLPDTRRFGRDLQAQLRRVDSTPAGRDAGKKFGSSFGKQAAAAATGGILADAFRAIGRALSTPIRAASDMNETLNKSNTIFGKNATSITKWASTAATSFGLSRGQALEAASGFGDMFKQIGFSDKAALSMSKTTVKLSADLGSFNNLPTADVQERIAAAFRGEYDSLQKVIPNINAARVQQVALATTGKTAASALTAQEKAAAVLAIVQKDGARASGDFAKTQGEVANQAKIARAQLGDIAVTVGKVMMPAVKAAMGFLTSTALPGLGRFADAFGKRIGPVLIEVSGGFRAFGAAFRAADGDVTSSGFAGFMERLANLLRLQVLPALNQFGGFVRVNVLPALRQLGGFVTGTLLPAWLGWYKFLISQMLPILRQVGAFFVANVIPALRSVARFIAREVVPAFLSIMETVKGLVRVVAPIIGQLVGVILGKFKQMRPEIKTIWTSVKEIITGVMFVIREVIQAVTTIIRLIWSKHGESIKRIVGGVFSGIFRTIAGVMKAIAGVIKLVVALIKGDWRGAWNAIRQIFSGVWQAIRTILAGALRLINANMGGFFTRIRSGWSTFWGGVKTTASNAMAAVRSGISTVLGRITTAFSTAKSNIARIWNGVKAVVSAPINWVKNNVYNRPLVPVWNRVAGLVGGPKLSTYATGGVHGVRPGYTPGRDNQVIAVGGGEAIMRPEWTRVAGKGYVDAANKAARTGGTRGVGEFLAHEGLPGFAGGGVVGWLRNKVGAAGDLISGLGSKLKGWVLGGLRAAAGGLLTPVKRLIDRNMPNTGVGNTVGGIGKKAIDLLLDKIKSVDVAPAVSGQGGVPGSGTGSRRLVRWHGGTFTDRFRNTLERAQALAGRYIPVTQGGFRPRTSYSGTSHQGDAIDTLRHAGILSGLRRAGTAAWFRGPAQGMVNHIHGIPLPGFGFPGGSGIWQAQDYLRGGNGLAMGGIVRGGRGGVATRVGEGQFDELVTPLPRNWKASTGAPGVVELGPRSIAAIASALTVEIDGRQVARAVRYQGIRGTT